VFRFHGQGRDYYSHAESAVDAEEGDSNVKDGDYAYRTESHCTGVNLDLGSKATEMVRL